MERLRPFRIEKRACWFQENQRQVGGLADAPDATNRARCCGGLIENQDHDKAGDGMQIAVAVSREQCLLSWNKDWEE